jgi:prepilin-type N-terminal cleavage/methylation domain-containing protein
MRPTRRGFTLIELLMVVIIIGLLAAIVVARYASTKGQAFVTAMKADLRNLASAQEAYLGETQAYYNGPIPGGSLIYAPTSGVTITLSNVTAGGWQASATHTQTSRSCAIFMGTAPPLAPATAEGSPGCS